MAWDLFRSEEIRLLTDAIQAMTFSVDYVVHDTSRLALLRFEGREAFRIDLTVKRLLITALSGTPEEVYAFHWWRWQDFGMWRRLTGALRFYDHTVHKVRRQDYRALFGSKMADIIKSLADLLDAAEKEARALAKIDRTHGGNTYHPEVARMVQREEDP